MRLVTPSLLGIRMLGLELIKYFLLHAFSSSLSLELGGLDSSGIVVAHFHSDEVLLVISESEIIHEGVTSCLAQEDSLKGVLVHSEATTHLVTIMSLVSLHASQSTMRSPN